MRSIDKIIIMNGPALSGKGTFIRMARLLLSQHEIPVISRSSIFPTKKFMVDNGLWDGVSPKTQDARRMMFEIKERMVAEGNIPNNYLVEEFKNLGRGVMFVNIREPKQIESFIELCEKELQITPITIYYSRETDSVARFETGVDRQDQAKQYQNYDFMIENSQDGLEHMTEIVVDTMERIFPEFEFTNISIEDVVNDELHRQWDDEMSHNII